MAERKFLVDINLNGNQLTNVRLQNATSSPTVGNGGIYYDSTANVLKFNKNGTWTALAEGGAAITAISLTGAVTGTAVVTDGSAAIATSIANNAITLGTHTTGNYVADLTAGSGISVSGGNQETANITVTNTDKGSSQNIFKNIAVSGQTTVVAEINDDTLTLVGSGITITTDAASDTITFTNAGVTSIAGTTNQITASASTGSVTLSLPNSVTMPGDLIVTGDLTVNGTTTTLNTQNLLVEDNIVVLNSNVTGTPSINGGIEIERGTSTNAAVTWNESTDKWTAGLAGSESVILLSGIATAADISGFTESVQDVVGDTNFTKGTNSLSVTYDDAGNTLTFDTTLAASNSYLTKTSGLAVDKTTLETALVTDGFTKKYSVNNPVLTASGGVFPWTVTHNLGSDDVIVQIREVGSKQEIETQVVHTSANVVTISFNDVLAAGTLAADTYRVVVIG